MIMFGNAQTCRCHLMLGRGAGRVAGDKPEPNAGSSNGRARSDHPGLLGRKGKPAGRRGAGSLASDRWQMAKALLRCRRGRSQDRPRSGKPPTYDATFRNRVLELLEKSPPPGWAHWDGRAVAECLRASVHAVWRVLRREGIYLQRLRTWGVSTDPEFAPKAAEVVGL
jgi:hypothetical protein